MDKTKINWKKKLITAVCIFVGLCVVGAVLLLGLNAAIVLSADKYILSPEEAAKLQDVDCVLVLGCGVRDDGSPSAMLRDRLRRSVELYQNGAAPKLLMSGDHGQENYNEVDAMKSFAVASGIPSDDVFMDHAGFSTYESMYRAKEVFQAKKVIIVTQSYHLYRSIYIARSLGLEAYGVDADLVNYRGATQREIREVLARAKDVFTCMFKPKSTYVGEPIPIWGNGELTHDEGSKFS